MTADTPTLLVHYQELALKGRNRPWFVDRLVRNIREATTGLGVEQVWPVMGRIEVTLRPSAPVEAVIARLEHTLGVAAIGIARRVAPELEAIAEAMLALVATCETQSFRVRAVRADKRFPVASPDIERHVGARIRQATGWRVDLSNPALVARVEVLPGAAYCSVDRRRGPAGLPVGVSGRVVCLLSGGIDSPVAAYRLMRRGCRVVFVHFHSQPLTNDVSQRKARLLATHLTRFQLRSRLALVPFADIQRQIAAFAPAALRVVLYRRFMLRIAERIARRSGARALVTGEVIGQVASQTLENLAVIDAATVFPVFRPLIGMDKEDIVAEARRIGTFEISNVPDEDCCRVFVPAHPAINARFEQVEAVETSLEVETMIQDALGRTVREQIGWSAAGAEVC